MTWIAGPGAQWRQRPDDCGKSNSVYRRWTTTDVFDATRETLAELVERDGSAGMIDVLLADKGDDADAIR